MRKCLCVKNEASSVDYCEDCNVVTMEIGAVSLRVGVKDLQYQASLLKHADTEIAYYRLKEGHLTHNTELTIAGLH